MGGGGPGGPGAQKSPLRPGLGWGGASAASPPDRRWPGLFLSDLGVRHDGLNLVSVTPAWIFTTPSWCCFPGSGPASGSSGCTPEGAERPETGCQLGSGRGQGRPGLRGRPVSSRERADVDTHVTEEGDVGVTRPPPRRPSSVGAARGATPLRPGLGLRETPRLCHLEPSDLCGLLWRPGHRVPPPPRRLAADLSLPQILTRNAFAVPRV